MRIGLVRMRYTPFGGAEVFLKRFITKLLERGHRLDVFSSSWEEEKGVTVHKIDAGGPAFLRPWRFATNVAREVGRVRPDITLSLERTFSQEIYRAGDGCHREWLIQRGKRSGALKRASLSLSPKHKVLLALEERLFKGPGLKAVVANSKRVKDEIIRHYGLPAEKICVIYNGIDATAFEPDEAERARLRRSFGADEETVVCLFTGSGFERKGLAVAIRALALLKDKGDIRLVVIGKGSVSPYLEEAKKLGVSERVVFMGPVEGASRYCLAGDIFVLPTIYEPFSNACLEAMAAGLPVVTTRANGASEILIDGESGGIVEDPDNHEEVAAKIEPFLDKSSRLTAGRLARTEALKHPMERTVAEFLDLMEGLKITI
ncbi:MAG: glycosyltransferase family 4 protein [Deltaproteobacteria bacterium]|nr:glycosyltransferase family 4 protein [Deltaproteobacteria bacterium]